MERFTNWVAPTATTAATLMVALSRGARFTGYGFIVLCLGCIGWMAVGWFSDQANLVWQNVILLIINLIGVWQWLELRARYEMGAADATRRSIWRLRR